MVVGGPSGRSMLATLSVLTAVLQTTGSRTAQVRKSSFAIIDAIHAAASAVGGANKSPSQISSFRPTGASCCYKRVQGSAGLSCLYSRPRKRGAHNGKAGRGNPGEHTVQQRGQYVLL